MLFIIEGLSMYLTAEENGKILKIIKDNFVMPVFLWNVWQRHG